MKITILCFSLSLVILGGCKYPIVKHPVSAPVGGDMPSSYHLDRFPGDWQMSEPSGPPDGAPIVRVGLVDRESAKVHLKIIEPSGMDENDGVHAYLRRGFHGMLFLSAINADQDSGEETYSFCMLKPDGDSIYVWQPEPLAFKRAIREGVLEGRIVENTSTANFTEGEIYIDSSHYDISVLLNGPNRNIYFRLEKPYLFVKVDKM